MKNPPPFDELVAFLVPAAPSAQQGPAIPTERDSIDIEEEEEDEEEEEEEEDDSEDDDNGYRSYGYGYDYSDEYGSEGEYMDQLIDEDSFSQISGGHQLAYGDTEYPMFALDTAMVEIPVDLKGKGEFVS